MKILNKRILKLSLIILIIFLALAWFVNYMFLSKGVQKKSKATGENVTLSFDPSTVTAPSGEFNVTIKAKPTIDMVIRGYVFTLQFDKTKLQARSITYKLGTVSSGVGDDTGKLATVNSTGFINVQGEIQNSTGQTLLASANTDVVTIAFTADASTDYSTSVGLKGDAAKIFYMIAADYSLPEIPTALSTPFWFNSREGATNTPVPTNIPPPGSTNTPVPTAANIPTATPTVIAPTTHEYVTQSLISINGIDSYTRTCTVDSTGVNWSSCPTWSKVILNGSTVSGNANDKFIAYGAFSYTENGQQKLSQSLLSIDRTNSYGRSCNINTSGVDWSGCSAWSKVVLDGNVISHNPAEKYIGYGAFSFMQGSQQKVSQSLIAANGKDSYGRYCNVNASGVDWSGCSAWSKVTLDGSTISGNANEKYTDYGAFTYTVNGQQKVTQSLVAFNGRDSYARTCNINSSGVDWSGCTAWSKAVLDPNTISGKTTDSYPGYGAFTYAAESISIPTSTPVPTATSVPTAINLNLKLKFQGISRKPVDALNKLKVAIKVKSQNFPLEKTFTTDFVASESGVWSGQVEMPAFPPDSGYFYLLVKGPKHLQKKICDAASTETAEGTYRCSSGRIKLVPGENNLDFSGIRLLAGDLPQDADGYQNGVVDAYDLSLVRNNLGKSDTDSLMQSDINLDGAVNAMDFSLILNSLSIKYDEEGESTQQ